jgi:flagellin
MEHLNIMTQSDAREALTKVTTYNQRLLQELGAIGSQMSRLDIASSFVASYRDELKIAGARIMDADVALESSELVRRTVLQQAASAVLVQANQLPALSLKLLQ